jgi:hypothetical protein
MRTRIVILALSGGLIAACNRGPDPYLPPGDSRGTPADRTGGATNEPIVTPDGKYIYPPVLARKS